MSIARFKIDKTIEPQAYGFNRKKGEKYAIKRFISKIERSLKGVEWSKSFNFTNEGIYLEYRY